MQLVQEQVARTGTGITLSAGFTGFVAKAIPVLQVVSLTVSIVVGVLTGAWYAIKHYEKWKASRKG